MLGARASYVAASPPYLLLEDVKVEDEGSYHCRLEFREARTQWNVSDLVVIGEEEVGRGGGVMWRRRWGGED